MFCDLEDETLDGMAKSIELLGRYTVLNDRMGGVEKMGMHFEGKGAFTVPLDRLLAAFIHVWEAETRKVQHRLNVSLPYYSILFYLLIGICN